MTAQQHAPTTPREDTRRFGHKNEGMLLALLFIHILQGFFARGLETILILRGGLLHFLQVLPCTVGESSQDREQQEFFQSSTRSMLAPSRRSFWSMRS